MRLLDKELTILANKIILEKEKVSRGTETCMEVLDKTYLNQLLVPSENVQIQNGEHLQMEDFIPQQVVADQNDEYSGKLRYVPVGYTSETRSDSQLDLNSSLQSSFLNISEIKHQIPEFLDAKNPDPVEGITLYQSGVMGPVTRSERQNINEGTSGGTKTRLIPSGTQIGTIQVQYGDDSEVLQI
jgi:hypothetical protein